MVTNSVLDVREGRLSHCYAGNEVYYYGQQLYVYFNDKIKTKKKECKETKYMQV